MTRWFREESRNGTVHFRLGRDGKAVVAEWLGLGTFRSDRTPRLDVAVGADPQRVAKLMAGGIRAIERGLVGERSFHAASVAFGEPAVMLSGESGAGKSTIAEALVALGGELLADDMAFVDRRGGEIFVSPGEVEHWLTPRAPSVDVASASTRVREKVAVPARRLADTPRRLEWIVEVVVEDSGSAVTTERLRGAASMVAISRSMLLLSDDEASMAAHFADVSEITKALRGVLRIHRPSNAEPHEVARKLLRATLGSHV